MEQAEACKSVEMAMKKCPNGMLAEVKYDGERVQVHKKGNEFRYFSRSLKPVLSHKVNKSVSFRFLIIFYSTRFYTCVKSFVFVPGESLQELYSASFSRRR